MNKELQDKAWSVLPKEFKEEVKKYFAHYRCAINTYEAIINHIFGRPNLTSDAEEEEMLTVSRKDVVELYQEVQKTISSCKGTGLAMQSIGIKNVLWSFFGSKCLPDDTKDDTKEPKPAEPKKESRNLSQEIANCDKHFDNILKGSFRNERRLNIAASIAAGAALAPTGDR